MDLTNKGAKLKIISNVGFRKCKFLQASPLSREEHSGAVLRRQKVLPKDLYVTALSQVIYLKDKHSVKRFASRLV